MNEREKTPTKPNKKLNKERHGETHGDGLYFSLCCLYYRSAHWSVRHKFTTLCPYLTGASLSLHAACLTVVPICLFLLSLFVSCVMPVSSRCLSVTTARLSSFLSSVAGCVCLSLIPLDFVRFSLVHLCHFDLCSFALSVFCIQLFIPPASFS